MYVRSACRRAMHVCYRLLQCMAGVKKAGAVAAGNCFINSSIFFVVGCLLVLRRLLVRLVSPLFNACIFDWSMWQALCYPAACQPTNTNERHQTGSAFFIVSIYARINLFSNFCPSRTPYSVPVQIHIVRGVRSTCQQTRIRAHASASSQVKNKATVWLRPPEWTNKNGNKKRRIKFKKKVSQAAMAKGFRMVGTNICQVSSEQKNMTATWNICASQKYMCKCEGQKVVIGNLVIECSVN